MTTYTPSNNIDPTKATYGENSAGVTKFQVDLNLKNAGKPGYVPLVVDGKYGPLTQAAANFGSSNPGILASTGLRTGMAKDSNTLDNAQNDPYMEYLLKQKMTVEDRMAGKGPMSDEEKRSNLSTTAAGAKKEKATQDMYDKYKAGLEALGIQTGLSRYAPGLQQNQRLQADIQENTKLNEIQDAEDLAIAKAKEARDNKDATLLKSTIQEIQTLRKEKKAELEKQLENKRAGLKMLSDVDLMSSISEAVSKIPKEQQGEYLLNVANELGVGVDSLLGGIASAKKQWAWKTRAKTSGSGGGYTAQELRKLRAGGIDSTNVKMSDNFLYGENKGIAPTDYNKDTLITTYGKDKLWNLALALGIPRKKNLSKMNEINDLFNNPELTSYVQEMLASGYDIDQIISSQNK